MKILFILAAACVGILACGCRSMPGQVTSLPASDEYLAKEPLATSLFPADQAVLNDEAVARILSSRLELPAKAKLALMKFPDGRLSRAYWRDEEQLKLVQSQVELLSNALLGSEHIAEVTPLPSLMTPSRVSIPVLREAAVRMQADLLLVYRIGSETYSQSRAFAKDKVKAYSTCELVLLDVRTGLVPFAKVVSRENLELKQPADLDLSETMRRAEQKSAAEALKSAAQELVVYVKSVPKKGN